MRLKDTLAVAVRALLSAPLRSFLTMLGIVVGVAAVVLIAGLGAGLRAGFDAAYDQTSSRITVFRQGANQVGNPSEPLTEADLAAVERADPASIASVVPSRNGIGVLRSGSETYRGALVGAGPDALSVNALELAAGSFYTQDADDRRERVTVLGSDAVRYLFAGDARGALGRTVSLGRIQLRVVGALQPSGRTDNIAYMPLSVSRLVLAGSDNLNSIIVSSRGPQAVPAAVAAIYRVMDDQHRIRDPATRDYRVSAQVTQLERVNRFITFITFFIVGVAALSLFVGAIGVANIMLVTVTERTREVGLLKSLGARRAAVMRQFLAEAVLIAGLGGVLGAALGVALTVVGSDLVPRYVPQSGPLVVDPVAVVVAFGVSLLMGVLAGSYPAYRAARLRPIDALRA